MSNLPVTENTARNLINALERVLEALPSSSTASSIVSAPSVSPATTSSSTVRSNSSHASTSPGHAEPVPRRPVPVVAPPPHAPVPALPRTPSFPRLGNRRSMALQEHARVFGYTPSSSHTLKKKKKKIFSRIFVCLAGCDDELVPLSAEKMTLKANGIGETTIDFEVDGTAEHVADQILSTFKKEELTHGFELMVVKSKSRSLLEVAHAGPCSAKELKLLSSQRIYMRPMQQSIELTEHCPPSSQATLTCCFCGEAYVTGVMRDHVNQCKESGQALPRDDQIPPNDDPLPPINEPFSPREVQLSPDKADGQAENEPTDAGPTSNHDELQEILHLLKEGYDSNSNIKDIIEAFRQLYLQGRSLNISEGVEDFLEGDTYDLTVSRLDVFNSMVDELSAPAYNARLPLHVSFMGEKGQDLGGPRREFLRLGLALLYDKVTTGPAKSRNLLPDQGDYLDRMVYFVAGVVIGQSIMQDGPTPNFLAPALIDRLLAGVRENPEEAQFADGLMQTGIIDLIKAFPQCRCILHDEGTPTPPTANGTISLFNVQFAESGSNDRIHQELVYRHFVRYLREVEAGQHKVDGDTDGDVIRLQHIYKFVTGLEEMPVCGWNPPLSITFTKQDVGLMGLGASTCTHHLQLPVPRNATDPMPSRNVLFDLFNKSIADEFFGTA